MKRTGRTEMAVKLKGPWDLTERKGPIGMERGEKHYHTGEPPWGGEISISFCFENQRDQVSYATSRI